MDVLSLSPTTTMPPARKVTYRSGLFDAQNLSSIEGIENALLQFSTVLTEANHNQVLQDLLNKDRIIELVLSGVSPSLRAAKQPLTRSKGLTDIPLSQWILAQYPTAPTQFESSFHAQLLSKLSTFLLFQLSPREDLPTDVRDHQGVIKNATDALRILQTLTFEGASAAEEPIQWARVKVGKSQRAAKLAKKAASAKRAVDDRPFVALDLELPQSKDAADDAACLILGRLRDILEVRTLPIIVTTIKSSFHSVLPEQDPAS